MIPDFEVEALRVINYLASERTNLLAQLGAVTLELATCRQELANAPGRQP